MTRARKAGLAVLLLAILYPLAAWFLGARVEAALGKQYAQLGEQGLVSVVSRDYQRGIFSASETVTLQLSPRMSELLARSVNKPAAVPTAADPAVATPAPDAVPPAAPVQPLRFTIHSEILHGPLPGARAVGAALVYSELVLDDGMRTKLSRFIGDHKPLDVRTRFGFFGGGVTHVATPPIKARFEDSGKALQLAVDGMQMRVDFSAGLRHYAVDAELPNLDMQAADTVHLHMAGMRVSNDAKRVFGEGSQLYAGSSSMNIDEMTIEEPDKPAFSMQKLSYSAEMPQHGDYVDFVGKLGADAFKVSGQDYGPVHYDFALHHLQAHALESLQQANSLAARLERGMALDAKPADMLAAMRPALRDLLVNQPVLNIERIQFHSPTGDATLSAEVSFKDPKAEDIDNPFALIGKLDMKADLSLPEDIMAKLLVDRAATAPGDAAQARTMLDQQLAMFAQQGYIERQSGIVKAHFAFNDGNLTLNGKPFGPAMAHQRRFHSGRKHEQ